MDVIGDGKIERKMAVIIFYFYAIYLISCIFRYHKSGSFIMQEYAIKEQKKLNESQNLKEWYGTHTANGKIHISK